MMSSSSNHYSRDEDEKTGVPLPLLEDGNQSSSSTNLDRMPMIPTRRLEQKMTVARPPVNEIPEYYVVLSPREIKGVCGPFTVEELREQIELKVINPKTLVWKGGNDSWHQTRNMPLLYPRIRLRPHVPERELEPQIPCVTALEIVLDSTTLPKIQLQNQQVLVPSLNKICSQCSAFASVRTPGFGSPPDVKVVSLSVGTILPPQVVSEIIPGFLWVVSYEMYVVVFFFDSFSFLL